MTLFKNRETGEWEKGYPYMQWPTAADGHHLWPEELMRLFGRRKIKRYEYEYLVLGGHGETRFATERKEEPEGETFRERLERKWAEGSDSRRAR